MATATQVVAKFTADVSDLQAQMGSATKAFESVANAATFTSDRVAAVGQSMADAGKKMTLGITLPLGGIAVAASTAAMSFETNMSKIVGLVGIAADEVAGMNQEVLNMAGAVGKSPDELAAGLFVVTSAGLRGAEAMSTLKQSAMAGAAGLGETNDIARAVAGALSAYGSEVLSASEATDAIVATARAGNFETSQFAAAIGRVLPFAQQAGASFQDMGGAVALLTRVNGDAAQSITQMQALFRAFVVPTEEAKKALSDVGLSAEELRASIAENGLPATLQMLDQRLGGNREQLGRLLGSSEAASAAFQILNADTMTISETFGVVAESAGMTAEAFGVVSGTAQFQVNQAMAELKATLIDLGEQFLPIIKTIMDFMQAHLKAFSSLPGPVKTVITVMAGLLAALGPILFIVGKLVVVFSTLISFMLKTRAIGAMRLAFAGLRGEMATTRASIQQTQTKMGMLATTAKTVRIAVVGSFKAIGAAAKGLVASLGPIGLAMLAIGGVVEIFIGKAAAADYHMQNLRDEIDKTTGKMTEAARVFIATELRTNISPEDLKMMEGYGITISGFLAALEQGGPALDAYREKITQMQAAQKDADGWFGSGFANVGTVDSVNTIVENLEGMIGYYEDAKLVSQDLEDAQVDAAMGGSDAARGMAASYRAAAQDMRGESGALQAVYEAQRDVILTLKQAFDDLLGVTSRIRGELAAEDAWKALKAAVEENGNTFKRTTEAGRENLDMLTSYVDKQVAVAAALEDPDAQLRILQDTLKNVTKAYGEGEKTPDQVAIVKTLKGAIKETKDRMGDLEDASSEALIEGNNIAEAIAEGIKAGMTGQESAIFASGELAGGYVEDGLNSSLEINSPSKVAMEKGRGVGEGLVSGLTGMNTMANLAGFGVGANVIAGMILALNNGVGPVSAAVRAVVAAAIAAAKDESQEGSPSKVFRGIGDNMIRGLEIGVTARSKSAAETMSKAARLFIRAFREEFMPRDMGEAETAIANAIAEAEDRLKEARQRVKDANKAVKEAEKALADARKDGDAKDITRAEKDLARARKEAAAAADDAKTKEWVKKNEKGLAALTKIVKRYDQINAAIAATESALAGLADLAAKPFGLESGIFKMFSSDVDMDAVARNFATVSQMVREAYGALTDPAVVGKKQARANRREMNKNLAEIESLAAQAIELRKEYEANLQEIATLQETFKADETKLQEALDKANEALDEANAELKALTDERDSFLNSISNGFMSFVNNFSEAARSGGKTLVRETRRLANGVAVVIEREMDAPMGAAGIRESLESRLSEVRAFSANIRTLMARGLDPTIVKDFVTSGVANAGDAAAALVAGSDADIQAINQVQRELTSEISGFQDYASAQWYDAAVAQKEAIVGPLEEARDEADKALALAREIFDAEMKRLEEANSALMARMDELSTQIEAIVINLANTLPVRTNQAGQDAIEKMLDGFKSRFPKLYRELNSLMSSLAASMNRVATITVRTVYADAPKPAGKRAMGGPVLADRAYLVGERGPELFIPGMYGNILPNSLISSVPDMSRKGAGAGGGTVVNVTVNAGMGANGGEIGREIVEQIKRFERTNGPVFAGV